MGEWGVDKPTKGPEWNWLSRMAHAASTSLCRGAISRNGTSRSTWTAPRMPTAVQMAPSLGNATRQKSAAVSEKHDVRGPHEYEQQLRRCNVVSRFFLNHDSLPNYREKLIFRIILHPVFKLQAPMCANPLVMGRIEVYQWATLEWYWFSGGK